MKILIIILLSIFTQELRAQINWLKDRQLYETQTLELEYPLYYLYRAIDYDFKYDESDQYICDITYHNIVRPSNDNALESINKIYIPTGGKVIDILNIRSRAISKSGKTIELDQNNIKEIEDEESDSGYRIFAVEGAEVGGEVEYLYTKRVHGSTFINEKIQFTSPIKRFEFTLQCPENLEFEFATVNDTTKVMQLDTLKNLNKYAVAFNNIPEFVSERFSAGDANIKRIDFKLAYNSSGGKKRLNTFSVAGKTIFENANTLSKEEQKALVDFIKKHDKKHLNAINRLRNLEHEAKKELSLDQNAPDDLAHLLKNKLGEKKAFVKLIVGVLNYLQIKYEIVATSGRFEKKFHESFDSWNYLDEYLIYLSNTQKYLAPHSMALRYGYVPSRLTATKGIFVSNDKIIDDYFFPITRIDYIPEKDYSHSMTDLSINVSFDELASNNTVSVKRTFINRDAFFFKYALLWMDQEKRKKRIEDVIRYLAPDADIMSINLEKEGLSYDQWNDPISVASTYNTAAYIEQAGPSILFKIGELIGPQSELYQEKERIYDIESLNNHGYHDDIIIQIPKGYTIQNPKDIIIDRSLMSEGRKVCAFKTSYEIDGQELKVTLDEYYDQLLFPANRFEEFREVINAAADWNKVVLVLKKG